MSDYSTLAEEAQHGGDPVPGLVPCPRCTDAVVDLDDHLKWCREPENGPESLADRVAAARALIADDEQQRMRACLADIEAALDKHGMSLHIEPARLTLVPKD